MTRKKKARTPAKPRPDFPLSPHPSGKWCKKIHGKLYYFGLWNDPEEALREYNRRLPEIFGTVPAAGCSVRQLCDRFLITKDTLLQSGELKQRTWDDYKATALRLIAHFGPTRPIETIGSADFELLRSSLPAGWGPVSVNNFIIRTRAIVNYAFDAELIDRPIRTGPGFKRNSAKIVRIARASSEAKFFSAAEIRDLVRSAQPYQRAMILLGVNLGYGSADCARLTKSMIAGGWISEPREKTGVHRIGKLWPETIEAVQYVIDHPRRLCPPELSDRVFVTRYGNPYWTDGGHDAVATAFYRLTTKVGCRRKGVGFYSLRHVTQTIGEQTGDDLAVKILMGHSDPSISARYREHFDRSRIEKVCDHLRNWFLQNQK